MIFFSVKAEITHFLNLTSGGPRGDLYDRYFTFGVPFEKKKIDFFLNNFKPK